MKKNSLIKSVVVASVLTSAMLSAGCSKDKLTSMVDDAKKDVEETKEEARQLQKDTKEVVSTITSKVEDLMDKEPEEEPEEIEEEEVDTPAGISVSEAKEKSYDTVWESLEAYAKADPEAAKEMTVLEYYGEEVCQIEYEKLLADLRQYDPEAGSNFTFEMYASTSVYEEAGLDWVDIDYEQVRKELEKKMNSSSEPASSYVPGSNYTELIGEGNHTGHTWETYDSGLGEFHPGD